MAKHQYDPEYYQRHKERINAASRKWQDKNRDHYLELMRQWRLGHKEYFKEYQNKYYHENKEYLKPMRKKATDKWRKNNPEKLKECRHNDYLKRKARNEKRKG